MNKTETQFYQDLLKKRRPGLPRGAPNVALSPSAGVAAGGVGTAKPSYIPATLDLQWSFEDSAQPSGVGTTTGTWAFKTDIAPPLDAGNVAMESTAYPAPAGDPAIWISPTFPIGDIQNPKVLYAWIWMALTTGTPRSQFSIARVTSISLGALVETNFVLAIDLSGGLTTAGTIDIRILALDGYTTLLTSQTDEQWYKLEFRNIDYTAFTADIYVNNILRANKAFRVNETTLTKCAFQNFPSTGTNRILHDLVTVGRN